MNFKQSIQAEKENIIKSICQLVSIPSTEGRPACGMPFGEGPAKALQYVLDLGRNMGFHVENFDNYAGHIEFGEGEKTLGILCHADVVPCGEGWIRDPYVPEIIDGILYGRGVLDDKGPLIVCLYAMKILKDLQIPLGKKVRLIVGTNEETNWGCMDYYFNQKHVPFPDLAFTPDAEFPLKYAEKGVLQYELTMPLTGEISFSGGNAVNSVPETATVLLPSSCLSDLLANQSALEKEYGCKLDMLASEDGIHLTVSGTAAHAARPEMGINAITGAMAAVDSLHLQGDLGAAADFYMKYIGKDLSGQHIGAGFSDNESGSLTFNVGKVTVRDHRLILSIDNRVPVTYSCHDVTLAVQKTIAKTPFSLEHEYATDSILIPRDSFLVTTLMDVYKRITGDINAKPEVDGGCTYARTMPNCVAFGALLPDQPNTMHEKNEGLHVRLIDTWMELYLEAIYQLAK